MNTVVGERYRGYPMANDESKRWYRATDTQEAIGRAVAKVAIGAVVGGALELAGQKTDIRFISGGLKLLGRTIMGGYGVWAANDIRGDVVAPRVRSFLRDAAEAHPEGARVGSYEYSPEMNDYFRREDIPGRHFSQSAYDGGR